MKTSEQLDKLAAALAKAQGSIKTAVKDATNPHYKAKYADLGAVRDAVHGPLTENGLVITQLPIHSEDNRAHLTTRLLHSSGQWIEEESSIPVSKQDAHGYGSAITYLRRYGVAALLFVVADEDDDANAAVKKDDNAKSNGVPSAGMEKHTARQVTVDAFDAMEPEEQKFLRDEAMIIIALHEEGKPMLPHTFQANYDTEEKLALWSLLPSKVRAALDREKKIAALQPAGLATQP